MCDVFTLWRRSGVVVCTPCGVGQVWWCVHLVEVVRYGGVYILWRLSGV